MLVLSRKKNESIVIDNDITIVVVEIRGELYVLLRTRIDVQLTAGITSVCRLEDDGKTMNYRFVQFYPMPGGQNQFKILYDKKSGLFWTCSTMVPDPYQPPDPLADRGFSGTPGNMRRILMLNYSIDGLNWFQAGCVAMSKNPLESFHYSSQVIVGDDLLVLSRSSIGAANQYRDYTWNSGVASGKAKLPYNNHDSNMITLHRVKNFRWLALDIRPDFEAAAADLARALVRVAEATVLITVGAVAQKWVPMTRWSRALGQHGEVPESWRGRSVHGLPERAGDPVERDVSVAVERAMAHLPADPSCLAQAFAGLEGVRNPSAWLLEDRQAGAAGSAVAVALEGTVPLLVEVQALAAPSALGTPRRVAHGLDGSRLSLLLAVLDRDLDRAGGVPFEIARDEHRFTGRGQEGGEPVFPAAQLTKQIALAHELQVFGGFLCLERP